MKIPGINLFKIATSVISPQPISYYKYKGRVLDKQRNYTTSYEEPITVMASVQAVPRNKYIELGLEFQKNYVKIWAAIDIIDIDRDTSGDMFKFGNKWFKLEDETPWQEMDGWGSCLAVEIKQSFPNTGEPPQVNP